MSSDAKGARQLDLILADILYHGNEFHRAIESSSASAGTPTTRNVDGPLAWEAFRLNTLFDELSRAEQRIPPGPAHRWIKEDFGSLRALIDHLLSRWGWECLKSPDGWAAWGANWGKLRRPEITPSDLSDLQKALDDAGWCRFRLRLLPDASPDQEIPENAIPCSQAQVARFLDQAQRGGLVESLEQQGVLTWQRRIGRKLWVVFHNPQDHQRFRAFVQGEHGRRR
jgi:hypothetical protein